MKTLYRTKGIENSNNDSLSRLSKKKMRYGIKSSEPIKPKIVQISLKSPKLIATNANTSMKRKPINEPFLLMNSSIPNHTFLFFTNRILSIFNLD